jgi:hypothetical protein
MLLLQVVAEGETTAVFLDSGYRPVRMPAEVKTVFSKLAKEYQIAKRSSSGGDSH